jgi:hypothetical protein
LQSIVRKIAITFVILAVVYLGLGLGFHFKWENAQAACREERAARGEFVEPEVFGGFLGFFFDVTFWPVYAQANFNLDGTLFSTPCTHPRPAQTPINNSIEEGGIRTVEDQGRFMITE